MTVNEKLSSLIRASNAKTGMSDATVTDAVQRLINGYGQGGEAYAVISVVYPAGSICTCSNGSKTLTAKDTSGNYLFVVPEGGTWTVSIVVDGSTYSKTINIDTYATVYELTITAWDGWIFNPDAGGDQTAITGGWERAGTAGVLTVNETYAAFRSGSAGTQRMAMTVNAIDFSGYSNLHVRAFTDGGPSSFTKYVVGLSTGPALTDIVISQQVSSTETDYTIPLDTLDPTQRYYVIITNAASGGTGTRITSCRVV